jgi:hypothetical protein
VLEIEYQKWRVVYRNYWADDFTTKLGRESAPRWLPLGMTSTFRAASAALRSATHHRLTHGTSVRVKGKISVAENRGREEVAHSPASRRRLLMSFSGSMTAITRKAQVQEVEAALNLTIWRPLSTSKGFAAEGDSNATLA